MSNPKSNYPAAQYSNLNGSDFAAATLKNVLTHYEFKEKPKTVEDLEYRIQVYFSDCIELKVFPDIEGLCDVLCVSRQGLLDWCNGKGRGKDPRWQEACNSAKRKIHRCLIQSLITGNINNITGIFLAKVWLGYRETQELVFTKEESTYEELPTVEEIAKKLPKHSETDDNSFDDLLENL